MTTTVETREPRRQEIATTRTLEKEIKAAELLRAQLADLAGDDPELIRDTIEGETNLREILADMVAADGEDNALVEAIGAYVKAQQDRKARIERRIDLRRSLMATALELSELKKLETASGTLSRKAIPPKAVITEEADIPAKFFAPQPPKLDKAALTKALKERATALEEANGNTDALDAANAAFPEIPGAVLSNGSTSVQIRR